MTMLQPRATGFAPLTSKARSTRIRPIMGHRGAAEGVWSITLSRSFPASRLQGVPEAGVGGQADRHTCASPDFGTIRNGVDAWPGSLGPRARDPQTMCDGRAMT